MSGEKWGLDIPFVSFGSVTSDDLFAPKEEELFRFYEHSRSRYALALDIGANIGVHTLLMRAQGWVVRAFEPDPQTFARLRENYALNTMRHRPPAELTRAAVSDHDGEETFVRLLDNMTGSHIQGDKKAYGNAEAFAVPVVDCRPLFAWADFAKIDCEGHEARLLLTTTAETRCEFMVEVGNDANARSIFAHMRRLKRKMWSQKRAWQEVQFFGDMPVHHSEGALFIGDKEPFA